ncbi:MAG: TlpA family protein disulfide reductase [Bacteroidetes bacterium]|nr:TlpA family protein disulfide reductase [Bacteroidota bacterium]
MHTALLFIALFTGNLVSGQEVIDKDFNSFYKEEITESKGIVIVNFWATWCKPCITELPYFEQINAEMKSEKFSVCLVNLDFNSKYKTSAVEFVRNKNLKSEVIHLNDTDPNKWINKIDSNWTGAIPATLIYNNGKKVFFREGEITYDELKSEINKLNKN